MNSLSIVPFSEWPYISANYHISKNEAGEAVLAVFIQFDSDKVAAEAPEEQKSRWIYEELVSQIGREETGFLLANTLDNQESDLKPQLTVLLGKIMQVYVDKFSGTSNRAKPTLWITEKIDVSKINIASAFELNTSIKTTEKIDIEKEIKVVTQSESKLSPDFGFSDDPLKPVQISVDDFAADLQAAFPFLKMAYNQSKVVALLRWKDENTENKGIVFKTGTPEFLDFKPLSHQLVDLQMTMPAYESGQFIADGVPTKKQITGGDTDRWAYSFSKYLDDIIDSFDLKNNYYRSELLQIRREIATFLAERKLVYLLDRRLVPEMYKDSLINQLSHKLSIGFGSSTLLQCAVETENTNADFILHGDTSSNSYKFSAFMLPFSANGKVSQLHTSLQPNSGKFSIQDLESVNVSLDFSVNSIELHAGEILKLVNPYIANRLENVEIPIFQKGIAEPAVLSGQQGIAQAESISSDPTETMKSLKSWDYSFSYQYSAGIQDTLYFKLDPKPSLHATLQDASGLSRALAQFAVSIPLIWEDLNAESDEIQYYALKSFHWIATQISAAFQSLSSQNSRNSPTAAYSFEVKEKPEVKDNPDSALSILLKAENEFIQKYGFPELQIDNFSVQKTPGNDGESMIYKFYTASNGSLDFVKFSDRNLQGTRKFTIPGSDILKEEMHSVSLSGSRNAELVNDQAVDPEFAYFASAIMFPEPVRMMIARQNVNITSFTPEKQKAPFQTYFANFFNELFPASAALPIIKLGLGFNHVLPEGISVKSPIVLAEPFAFDREFSAKLANVVESWKQTTNPEISAEDYFEFSLTVYSSHDELPLIEFIDFRLDLASLSEFATSNKS